MRPASVRKRAYAENLHLFHDNMSQYLSQKVSSESSLDSCVLRDVEKTEASLKAL